MIEGVVVEVLDTQVRSGVTLFLLPSDADGELSVISPAS